MNTTLSIIFYILISGISAWGAYIAQKKEERKWLLIPILVYGLVAGLRASSVGVDTASNIRAFYACLNNGNAYISKEYIYYHFAAFLLRLWENENLVLTVYALVIYALVVMRLWDFRSNTSLWVAVYLFGLFWFGGSMNGLRQYIAIAIVFFATRYLSKERYLLYVMLTLLAVSFHTSAVVALAFVMLRIGIRQRYTVKQAVVGAIGVIAVFPLGILLVSLYSNYLDEIEFSFGIMNFVRLFLLLLTCLVFYRAVVISQELINDDADGAMSVKPVIKIAILGALIGFASFFVDFASRLGYYFRIFEIVFYGQVFFSQKEKTLYMFILLTALTALGSYSLYRYNGIVPYQLAIG